MFNIRDKTPLALQNTFMDNVNKHSPKYKKTSSPEHLITITTSPSPLRKLPDPSPSHKNIITYDTLENTPQPTRLQHYQQRRR